MEGGCEEKIMHGQTRCRWKQVWKVGNTWDCRGQYAITNHHGGANKNKYQEKSLKNRATLQFLLHVSFRMVTVHNKRGKFLICRMSIWQRTYIAMATEQWVQSKGPPCSTQHFLCKSSSTLHIKVQCQLHDKLVSDWTESQAYAQEGLNPPMQKVIPPISSVLKHLEGKNNSLDRLPNWKKLHEDNISHSDTWR